jgi:hypothetical protein
MWWRLLRAWHDRRRATVCARAISGATSRANFCELVAPEALQSWLERQASLEAVVHMGAISSTTERDADLIST